MDSWSLNLLVSLGMPRGLGPLSSEGSELFIPQLHSVTVGSMLLWKSSVLWQRQKFKWQKLLDGCWRSYSTLNCSSHRVVSWHQGPPVREAKQKAKQTPASQDRLQAKKCWCKRLEVGQHALTWQESGWDTVAFPGYHSIMQQARTNIFRMACSPNTHGLTHTSQPWNQKPVNRGDTHHFQAKAFMSQYATPSPSLPL